MSEEPLNHDDLALVVQAAAAFHEGEQIKDDVTPEARTALIEATTRVRRSLTAKNWLNRCPDCRGQVTHAFSAHTGQVVILEDTFGDEALYAVVPGKKMAVAVRADVYRHHVCHE